MKAPLKLLQRRFYSFVGSWAGCCVVVVLTYAVILTLIRSLAPPTSIPPGEHRLRGASDGMRFHSRHNFSDNIAQRDMQKFLAFEPIDVVYSWVNGSDPVWSRKKKHYMRLFQQQEQQTQKEQGSNASYNAAGPSEINSSFASISSMESYEEVSPKGNAMSDNRYRDSEELRYSLRSLVKFAPWIRKIFIVTDNQIPYWLNLEATGDKLEVVPHSAIFPSAAHLPVFSSPAIESHLHRIPGLSKKFIYFNDDVFLGAPVFPEDFYTPARHTQRLYMSWDVPKCAPGCSDSWIGDGYCDKACNVSACNFDFPDCVNGTTGRGSSNRGGNTVGKGSDDRFFCAQGCPNTWLGDKVCDNKCRTASCGWDMGDCGVALVAEDFPGVTLLAPPSATAGAEASSFTSSPGSGEAVKDGLVGMNSQAVEVIKLLHRNASVSEGDGTVSAGSEGNDDIRVTVGASMWVHASNSSGAEGASVPTSSVEKEVSEENQGGADYSYPVALTVPYGVMGAYFNLSFIPCEALSLSSQRTNTRSVHLNTSPVTPYVQSAVYSPTCLSSNIFDPFSVPNVGYSRVVLRGQPVAWSNFSYSAVTYDIVEPHAKANITQATEVGARGDRSSSTVQPSELLTSLALVQKQHMLIMLLYGHPDFFEDPSTDTQSPSYLPPAARTLASPVDIRVTIQGYDFQSQVNLTARFALRIIPALAISEEDEAHAGNTTIGEDEQKIPRGMAPVLHRNASIVSCQDIRALVLREKELYGGDAEAEGEKEVGEGSGTDSSEVMVLPSEGVLRIGRGGVRVLPQPFLLPAEDHRFDERQHEELHSGSRDNATQSQGGLYIDHNWSLSTRTPITVSNDNNSISSSNGPNNSSNSSNSSFVSVSAEVNAPHTTVLNSLRVRQGLALSVSLLPQSLLPGGGTATLPLRFYRVRTAVTLSSGERRSQVYSLCEVLASLSLTGRVLPAFSAAGMTTNSSNNSSSRSAESRVSPLHACLHSSVSLHHSDQSFSLQDLLFPDYSSSKSGSGDRSNGSGISDTYRMQPLLLMVPIPISWRDASMLQTPTKPMQMFVKVEIFSQTPFMHNNNTTDNKHNVVGMATADSRVGCLSGPVLWGDSSSALDDEIAAVVAADHLNSSHSTSIINTSALLAGNSSVPFNSTNSNSTAKNLTSDVEEEKVEEDTYALSLIHVNKLYHAAFGAENRKVPAHMPHLIDSSVMEEMQQKWPKEWADTSSHRFRSSQDMQYAFAYYYYVAHRNKAHPPDLLEYLAEYVDTDSDGYLSDNEFLTLAAIIYQHDPKDKDMAELRNCSYGNRELSASTSEMSAEPVNSTGSDSTLHVVSTNASAPDGGAPPSHRLGEGATASSKKVAVTKTPYGVFTETLHLEVTRYPSLREVLQCSLVKEGLRKQVPWPEQHVFDTDKEVSFEMIGDNVTEVRTQLSGIRASRKKFVCVNDQMKDPSDELKALLQNFYLSYFPFPCEFERNPEDPNTVLYLDQYKAAAALKQQQLAAAVMKMEGKSAASSGLSHVVMQVYMHHLHSSAGQAWAILQRGVVAGRQGATRMLLLLCEWGGITLVRLSQWLEGQRDPDAAPDAVTKNRSSRAAEKRAGSVTAAPAIVDLLELHDWARGTSGGGGGGDLGGDGVGVGSSRRKRAGVNEDEEEGGVWIPYSVLCCSFLGLGFLLLLRGVREGPGIKLSTEANMTVASDGGTVSSGDKKKSSHRKKKALSEEKKK